MTYMAYIIETLPAIGEMVGRDKRTVERWIKYHGFPASKAPNGKWMTTQHLIDQWILARAQVMRDKSGNDKSPVRSIPTNA